VVVIFDEMQRILEYESDTVERQLRSIIQRHEQYRTFFWAVEST